MVTILYEGLTEGTARAGAGNAGVLGNLAPFFVLVVARLVLGERVSRLGVLGIVTGFGGIVLIVFSQVYEAPEANQVALGMAFAIAASAAWGVGTVIVKKLTIRYPELDLVGFTVGQFLAGGIVLTVLAGTIGSPNRTAWAAPELWLSVTILVIGSAAVGTIAYFLALRRVPASRASAWLFLVPVVAVLVEFARGNSFPLAALAGIAVTITGVALATFASVKVEEAAMGETAIGNPETS
jgi:drug/metabolite transporter (DMT)-like permease